MPNALGSIQQISSVVPGVGGIVPSVVGAVGSLFGGKDKSQNTPGLRDYIRSVNTPDGNGTDWVAHRVIGTGELQTWWAAHVGVIGWLPITNPDSYLRPPTTPMYLLPDFRLSMSPDSYVPFTGQAQTVAGGQAALNSIQDQLGQVDTIFVTNAKAEFGKINAANAANYQAALGAGGPGGPLEPVQAGLGSGGSTGLIIALAVLAALFLGSLGGGHK